MAGNDSNNPSRFIHTPKRPRSTGPQFDTPLFPFLSLFVVKDKHEIRISYEIQVEGRYTTFRTWRGIYNGDSCYPTSYPFLIKYLELRCENR
jgi:hypothetical protein